MTHALRRLYGERPVESKRRREKTVGEYALLTGCQKEARITIQTEPVLTRYRDLMCDREVLSEESEFDEEE